jgi:hypothetical protein
MMDKQKLLTLLGLEYINGRSVCVQANFDAIKWQNVKRGYVLDFTPEEIERFNQVVELLKEETNIFLKWSSLTVLRELLNNKIIILKPLIREVSKVEYDRILRFKRGEADLYDAELMILKSAFKKLHFSLT